MDTAKSTSATQMIDKQGCVWRGLFTTDGKIASALDEPRLADNIRVDEAYIVEARPVEFHCHGVGHFDFADLPRLELGRVEAYLRAIGVDAIVTVFVSERTFPDLLRLLAEYNEGTCGRFQHILGLALEGPLLNSVGGTPFEIAWRPTRKQWLELARAGTSALRYVVLSPDLQVAAQGTGSPARPGERLASVKEVVSILVESGIAPAFGHFSKLNPNGSASDTRHLLSQIARLNARGGTATPVFSDHLLNDMPTTIRYAWRRSADRLTRDEAIESMRVERWELSSLYTDLGPVPAVLIQAAAAGELTACLNFDGDHVDLAICRKIVDLAGTENLIAMTDLVEGGSLACRTLTRTAENSLLYQEKNVVAAGSQSVVRQQHNMRAIGLTESDIWKLSALNANRMLKRDTVGITLVNTSSLNLS